MAGARSRRSDDSRRSSAGPRPCAHCGAPVITQLVGQSAALNVTADTTPIPRKEAMAMREPNRLVWCLAVRRSGDLELLWRCRTACGHGAVLEHRCPAEARQWGRRPEGAMW
ncbi:hypothetical protein ACWGNR_10075 [Streptomyces althioticus]